MARTLLPLTAAIAVSACTASASVDAGPNVDQSWQVGAFDRIEVGGPYEVRVVSDGKTRVAANGSRKLLENTEVLVENGTLKIRLKKRGLRFGFVNDGHASFTVNSGMLKGAGIAGSGKLSIDKTQGDFDGSVAGSGDLELGAVEGGNVALSIGGSGDIKAAGKAESVKLSIAGSGDIDAAGVNASTAEVSIAGSGSAKAHASDTAAISIAGSGDVDIGGGAKCTVEKAGSGDVNCH